MSKKPRIIMALGRGKVRMKSLAAAEKQVNENGEYFIKREGAWFRPGAHGYTMELADAGVFAGKDASGYLTAEGVSLVPVEMMVSRGRKELRDLVGKAARLSGIFENYHPR